MTSSNLLPRIVLTPGEPAGIGPDLAVMLADVDLPCHLTLLSDQALIASRAVLMGKEIRIHHDESQPHQRGHLCVKSVGTNLEAVSCGTLNVGNAQFVYDSIVTAANDCHAGRYHAMVTGPVHKGIINDAGIPFSGHTELIAETTGSPQPVMVLVNDYLRVALVTTHLPLSQVSAAITSERITSVLAVLRKDLKRKFAIKDPHILVCGLNPHAGEGGHLGMEEIEIIEPTLAGLREQGYNLTGPLPADTAFTPDKIKGCDAVLAMFHDQGLPVIKSMGFGEIVNITFGLPIIRTSVDHGTALDIAGTGKAQVSSLICAIKQAISMANMQTKLLSDES
ncbi:MAG: 4-hydroxythreonine-4-phosphate dehydrogenase [Gammaproteobacteria bacterium]|jgi:4-hydroxythreonine-4-phosphate dehydrogenase